MTGQKISIAQLRPTQMTLGLDEVASRAAKIAAMGPADSPGGSSQEKAHSCAF